MKNYLLLLTTTFLFLACGKDSVRESTLVQNEAELNTAIQKVEAGSEIVLANGIWKDLQLKLYGHGTEESPITLRAETPGKVIIEGESYVHLGGEHLVVNGLHFKNGFSPNEGIIRFKIGKDSTAFYSRVTNCVIDGFTQPDRLKRDRWVEFYGKHNQLDHSYIAGKANGGVTVMVYHNGNENTNNHHQIVYNHFGPRPRKGGPSAETIRMGNSRTSMTPGYVNVSNNYFEACNGEVEVISDKTNFNSYTNNIFYKCEGSLVMRHANYGTIDGNIFIGGDDSDFYGGIRLINTGHWVTNNYFYKIRGAEFRSALAIMNGIPKSPINRYQQVTDVVVAHNTYIDCKSPWQIGVGQNKASSDVLPASEIRSAPPIRTTIANNLIYNTEVDDSPIINHDDIDGVLFKNNLLDNNGQEYLEFDAFINKELKVEAVNDWLYAPSEGQNEILDSIYHGYDFERITNSLFGETNSEAIKIGAITDLSAAKGFVIDSKKYGPSWFTNKLEKVEPNTIATTSEEGQLSKAISQAKSGDIIELTDETYTITSSISVDKEITIRSQSGNKVQFIYTGSPNSPLFEMQPKGALRLGDVALKGNSTQLAFAPLAKNMSSSYKLFLSNCTVDGFQYVLNASKGSFADSISFTNTTIKNCANGVVLAAEERGNYSAAMFTIDKCTFQNVSQNVINYFRGGYDESTIGGYLKVYNSTFENCGSTEKSKQLLKTRGIINVEVYDNTFKNNPVNLIALLWGEKNNQYKGNTKSNSGKIKVEQQLKLDLLY